MFNKLKRIVCRIFDNINIAFAPSMCCHQTNKIAIIKMDALGDGILWLEAGKAIESHFEKQGNEVYLFCNKSMQYFYEKYAGFQNIIAFSDEELRTIWGRRNAVKTIRKFCFFKMYNVTYSRSELKDDFIAKAGCALEKIGYEGDIEDVNKKSPSQIYDRLVKRPEIVSELIINAHFTRAIGINMIARLPDLRDYVALRKDVQYIVLGLGASNLKRAWDIDNFADVSNWIIDNTKYEIYVVGTKSEAFLYDGLYSKVKSDRLINLCGKTDLEGLINILGNAVCFICNDTGTAHLAAAVKTFGIVILGGGNKNRFFPHLSEDGSKSKLNIISCESDCFGCGWDCIFPVKGNKWRCIEQIKSEMVIQNLENILKF